MIHCKLPSQLYILILGAIALPIDFKSLQQNSNILLPAADLTAAIAQNYIFILFVT
ncbi:hypothetical protein COO91_04755 [Nostoc flagelliforme CCNUN1]|uniref:Uncharacterized protein n=1 Tax=Nostoc flagelliforme CCNUN1 TaxID=2038116 RepID=A0A2K8STW1_9NOSO|nr:hypothetical protein [Nostoc flagelliforme]AUB38780.1 hypothetical protein COO91_04755 [Nostoc flagelliforme CCNUN1]